MAKTRKKGMPKPAPISKPAKVKSFIEHRPNLFALSAIIFLMGVFFHQVLPSSMTLLPPDRINAQSYQPFVDEALSRGVYPLWCPYIFSGMPSYASLSKAPYVNILDTAINYVLDLFRSVLSLSEVIRYLFNYSLLAFFTFVLSRLLGLAVLPSLFAGIAVAFMPQMISMSAFGHSSKLITTALIPLVFLTVDQLLSRRNALFFALASLSLGWQLMRAHTQVTYYTLLMLGLYLIFFLVASWREKRSTSFLLSSVGLFGGVILCGVLLSAVLSLPVLEYSGFSIRGGGEAGGLDFAYATSWSFSPKEMATYLIPSFFGFGGATYWGPMPFSEYPFYMGVITLLLAGVAVVVRRDRYVLFFALLALLAIVTSFGRHLPLVYNLFFEILPFFNKFRVPVMIQILTNFAVAVLAGFGLNAILNLTDAGVRSRIKRYLYVFAGVGAALALFLLAGESVFRSWVAGSGRGLDAAAEDSIYQMAARDGLKMLAFVGIAIVLILSHMRGRVSSMLVGFGLIALMVVDMWLVGFRIIDPKPATDQTRYFTADAAVSFLKHQPPPFRIFPVVDNKPANWYMYHLLQNVKGYHAAKLRNYQDFLQQTGLESRDRFGVPAFLGKYLTVVNRGGQPALQFLPSQQWDRQRQQVDNAVLDMLNVKYLLSYSDIPDPRYRKVLEGQPAVFENTEVLPRAFFVDSVIVAADDSEFYNLLKSGRFNPHEVAVLSEPLPGVLGAADSNRVAITTYDLQEITLEAGVQNPGLMILSEVYYPAGWKAFVDGAETKILKANGILRAVFVPAGNHKISFVFEPASFSAGLAVSLSTLALMIGLLVFHWKFRRESVGKVSA